MTHYLKCHCGNDISIKRWRKGKRTCVDCGIARAIVHNLELSAKHGEGFRKWQAGINAIIESPDMHSERKENGYQG